MKRFLRVLLWSVLSLLILLGCDQFFLRIPQQQPAMGTIREFYLDFRTRLFHLLPTGGQISIAALIEKDGENPLKKTAFTPHRAKELSYFYADELGELRFADTLAEIPERFRKGAQRLEP